MDPISDFSHELLTSVNGVIASIVLAVLLTVLVSITNLIAKAVVHPVLTKLELILVSSWRRKSVSVAVESGDASTSQTQQEPVSGDQGRSVFRGGGGSRRTVAIIVGIASLVAAAYTFTVFYKGVIQRAQAEQPQLLFSQATLATGQEIRAGIKTQGVPVIKETESALVALTLSESKRRCFWHSDDVSVAIAAPAFDVSASIAMALRGGASCGFSWRWSITPKHYGLQSIVLGVSLRPKYYRSATLGAVVLRPYVAHIVPWDALLASAGPVFAGIVAALITALGSNLGIYLTSRSARRRGAELIPIRTIRKGKP
jgi:hypothetical protein